MSENVQQEPVESAASPNVLLKHIPDPISDLGEHENIVLATAETRRRRENDGQDSGIDSGRAEMHEWSGKHFAEPGPHESPASQVRRATDAMTRQRKEALGQQYLKQWGYSDQDAEALGFTAADEAAAMGRKPTEAPITKVPVIREDGTAALELRDDQPITEELSFRSIQDAKRAMKDYRDLQEAQADALRAEFAQRQEQERATQQPPEQQAPQPEPVAQPVAHAAATDPQVVAARNAWQAQSRQAQLHQEYQAMGAA